MAAQAPDPNAVAHLLVTHPSDGDRGWASDWVRYSGWPLALDTALELLQAWVSDADENIRRFASELTRPKGVWCAPIRPLQAEPQRALKLLEPLRADSSRYMKNSVANWLKAASKTQGLWVEAVCARWQDESPCEPTRCIVRRVRRSLDKA